jgi:surface carbohydrate biosynthesis protein
MNKATATELRPVILPAEIRVREFDAKLLLACCLAERGVPVFIGQRTEVDLMAARFPRSIYVAKGLTQQTRRHFVSARNFGHEVVAWDEEAICYLDRDIYYGRRLGERTVPLVSHLIAWGEDNAELWKDAAERSQIPVHVLGNPRADLLRRELRPLLEPAARDLRARHGRFILINSNFGSVNNLIPSQTRFREDVDPKKLRRNDRIGYHPGQAEYKLAMFKRMLEVPGYLAEAFPDTRIIVRPHPAENHEAWKRAAAGHRNVKVIYRDSVLPWIAAAACVVHSTCTTGLEAYLLDVPAIALRYPGGHELDNDLPNRISYSVEDKADMPITLAAALAGGLPPYGNSGRSREQIARHIASLEGPLASDRIADFLSRHAADPGPPQPGSARRLLQHSRVLWRRTNRALKSGRADHTANLAWRDHQFPEMTAAEVNAMIADFGRLLRRFSGVRARRIGPRVYELGLATARRLEAVEHPPRTPAVAEPPPVAQDDVPPQPEPPAPEPELPMPEPELPEPEPPVEEPLPPEPPAPEPEVPAEAPASGAKRHPWLDADDPERQ